MKIFPLILLLMLAVVSSQAQTILNVTNYGAVGDAFYFNCHTTSNSAVIHVDGTNFASGDIGKVIEVFRTGPWTYWNTNPINGQVQYTNNGGGVFSTNQDSICYIVNVTQGTNLFISIPQGWTTNTYAVVGKDNRTNFQNCIDAAQVLVESGDTNVIINIPNGKYLLIPPSMLDTNFIAGNINFSGEPALTITHGGMTFLGESTNAVLMGCGAGMERTLWNNYGDPYNTWPYGNYGAYVPVRGQMFVCRGPITNNSLPLVFKNLTIDGGLPNGLQDYNYYIIKEGNGTPHTTRWWTITRTALPATR